MFRYTYAGMRDMKMQMETEDRHMSRVMRTSIGTVTQVSLNLQEKKNENKKMVMNTEQNTKHADRATQVERQVEKKAYAHDTASQKQANRQGMCLRETEAIIRKAPRLWTHTRDGKITPIGQFNPTLRGISRKSSFIFWTPQRIEQTMLWYSKTCWDSYKYESLASLRASRACPWLPPSLCPCVFLAMGFGFFVLFFHVRFSSFVSRCVCMQIFFWF